MTAGPGSKESSSSASVGLDAGGAPTPKKRRWLRWAIGITVLLSLFSYLEMRSSWLQSRVLSSWAADIGYSLESGPAGRPVLAASGPYDQRFGYTQLPEIVSRLEERGFEIVAQAQGSERLDRAIELGLFPIYDEKPQAGLKVVDRSGQTLFEARYPEAVYPSFESIPDPVVRTLLFIENRELLGAASPTRNPAVEWDRLAGSALAFVGRQFGRSGAMSGASTLATQIEKFRHSPDGVTRTPRDKIGQMATASVRAYSEGPNTYATRRRIVLDYVNSVPLAAAPTSGEVIGLLGGLRAWYGLDPDTVNRLLHECPLKPDTTPNAPRVDSVPGVDVEAMCGLDAGSEVTTSLTHGEAFRAVLNLILAQRRPSYYLARAEGRADLDRLADTYLDLLESRGEIRQELIDAARGARVQRSESVPAAQPASFVRRKAATAARTHLLSLTGTSRFYDLDRFDLGAGSTIETSIQDSVTALLRRLGDPEFVRQAGLTDRRLLATGDPSKVVYSFVLYEQTPDARVVRVQTDNFEGPFDLNASSRLELGSTAKLRTLVTYLEIVERLHTRLAPLAPEAKRAIGDSLPDPLTRWAIDYLDRQPETTRAELITAAMDRTYSANPNERFFTGGGSHVFRNFDSSFDGRVLSVRAGFRHSVNLVFVRMMRDVERFYRWRVAGASAQILEDPADTRRQAYLDRFVEREGRIFVSRFYSKFRGKSPEEVLASLVEGRRMTPLRLAWVFRSVRPDAEFAEFASFIAAGSANTAFAERAMRDLYDRSDAQTFSLADQGYLASVHPLELWVARHRIEQPGDSISGALAASSGARHDVYTWLFSARRQSAQDRSISVILELEAFLEIQRAWQRLGYPFENLVPSLGTAIGSSGDRPGSLADLVGTILNDGIQAPLRRMDWLHFAAETPFETYLAASPSPGERVLSSELAGAVREALLDVVEQGTARSIQAAAPRIDGVRVPIGGKTGTGDNRFRVLGPGGQLTETRVVNRTATFAFFLGDRHFGVVTAHVPGQDAAAYQFTSSLPVRVLALILPHLQPLLE